MSKLVTRPLLLEYHRALYSVLFSSVRMVARVLQKCENAAVCRQQCVILSCHADSIQECAAMLSGTMVPASYVQLAPSRDGWHVNGQRTACGQMVASIRRTRSWNSVMLKLRLIRNQTCFCIYLSECIVFLICII